MKRKFEMKTNYIKPEIEIIVTALGSSFLQESITGITGTIPGDGIDNGGNGDGLISTGFTFGMILTTNNVSESHRT